MQKRTVRFSEEERKKLGQSQLVGSRILARTLRSLDQENADNSSSSEGKINASYSKDNFSQHSKTRYTK